MFKQVVQEFSLPRVSRQAQPRGTSVEVDGIRIGDGEFAIIAGPCAVESREQILQTARRAKALGAVMLRGGAFKPRTSPYAFQGLGWQGVDLLAEAGRAAALPTVSEVLTIDQVERMALHVDVLQIGARNMQNFDLLKSVGRTGKPVLLKRGFSATIDELLAAAEYILAEGNPNVILCERGIRTFEQLRATRSISLRFPSCGSARICRCWSIPVTASACVVGYARSAARPKRSAPTEFSSKCIRIRRRRRATGNKR